MAQRAPEVPQRGRFTTRLLLVHVFLLPFSFFPWGGVTRVSKRDDVSGSGQEGNADYAPEKVGRYAVPVPDLDGHSHWGVFAGSSERPQKPTCRPVLL